MVALPTLTCGTYTNVSDTAITGTEPVLQSIASAVDTRYVYDATNSTHAGTARFALDNMPTDFGNMTTLSCRVRYGLSAAAGLNTWDSATAQVFKSDGTTALTNAVTVVTGTVTNTTPANGSVVAFTGVDTAATKAEWDGAVVHLVFNITRNKGGDTVDERVYAAELTGTYAAAATTASGGVSAPVPALASSALVSRSASGAIASPVPAAAGTATATGAKTASGGVTATVPALASTATVGRSASGAITSSVPTLSGTATKSSEKTASGGVATTLPALGGTAERIIPASGAITAPVPSLASTATVGRSASGDITTPTPALASSAIVGRSASGGVTATVPALAGTANLEGSHTATGGIAAPTPVISGTAVYDIPATEGGGGGGSSSASAKEKKKKDNDLAMLNLVLQNQKARLELAKVEAQKAKKQPKAKRTIRSAVAIAERLDGLLSKEYTPTPEIMNFAQDMQPKPVDNVVQNVEEIEAYLSSIAQMLENTEDEDIAILLLLAA